MSEDEPLGEVWGFAQTTGAGKGFWYRMRLDGPGYCHSGFGSTDCRSAGALQPMADNAAYG
jgi:hypothetical protein